MGGQNSINKISLKFVSLVFSIMTIGSEEGHLRKLGAKTMDRFEASILVTLAISGLGRHLYTYIDR